MKLTFPRISDTALLFSGGTDSFIAWHFLLEECGVIAHPLHFPMGTAYSVLESHAQEQAESSFRSALRRKFPHRHWDSEFAVSRICNLQWLGSIEEDDGNIPARNLHLLLGAAHLGFNRVCLVVQEDEMSVPDRTSSFFITAQRLISELFGRRVEVFTPFVNMDKTDMVKWYVDYAKAPLADLHASFSCLRPQIVNWGQDVRPCGDCPACFRRAVAFRNARINLDHCVVHPLESPTAQAYLETAKQGSKYSEKRNRRIIDAMQSLE